VSIAKPSVLFPIGLLLIAMASIQSGASLAKSLFPVIGAQGTTALRLVFASLIMLALLRPWRAKLDARGLRMLVYLSLQTVPLGIAVALEFTGPLFVALRASRRLVDFAWIALAVLGMILLVPFEETQSGIDPLGAAYAIGAGMFWALYIVFGQKAGHDNGVQTAALGVLIAAVFIAPIGIAHAGSALLDARLLPAAIGVAVLSTALPYSLEMMALTRLPARTFSTLTSIEPAFAAVSGLLFMNEVLSLTQWLAIASIIIASIGATLSQRKAAPPAVAMD
jgi:inner membrane transporter RhtA